ncbi:MAG TPA: RagB/SusD family nutrient uptake outer membrane protein [Longimicrobium sp.]|nr:RagB/SusD family nutrient uptake outer membrane protein [Longimicrobium sp.]
MKTRIFTAVAAAALILAGAAACTDLTTEPKSDVTGANIFNDPSSYRAFLAKLYAGLAVTGQEGPAASPGTGNQDIEGIDEGFSQYVRLLWQMQELPTDEAVIAWGDDGVQELNTQRWGTSNQFLGSMYYRVFFQVMQANEFLRETTDAKLSERNASEQLKETVAGFRAEARFLRALSYWHGIDLFGDIPLVTEADPLGSTPPEQASRTEIFDFVVGELNAILVELPAPGQGQYGRADRGAAQMLLAKLYLNSEVYTGVPRYAEARAAAEAVIASGAYQLDDDYQHIFLADNHTSPELIFAVTQDGRNTQSYGGTTFLTHASVGGSMSSAAFGLDGGWWGLRVRPEIVALYPGVPNGPDRRARVFFTEGQTVEISSLTNFNEGIAAPKYRNVTSTGQPGSSPGFADTDYPMFRLADAYLMYAEAVLRGGGGTRPQALEYVNLVRRRAYGNNTGDITDAQLTLDFLLDERARELLWEGHRRTDLVRFDLFTDKGIWVFKGGAPAGTTTEPHLDLYPLPESELTANPKLTQNEGYEP